MKPSPRRVSREFALQGVYQWLFTGASAAQVLGNLEEMEGFGDADAEFLVSELKGTIGDAAALRERLEPLADRKWDEVSPVERAILLIGAWELVHSPEIPYRVTINEAIELGKTFGATDGHKWVNGVLDKLAAAVRPEEVARGPRERGQASKNLRQRKNGK
jgi:transcription antitermination protein NusB